MEEIILRAKAGPPKSKLVGNHIEVTKTLENASIVETHKSRRITGKQSLNATIVRRQLVAAVKAGKDKTRAKGREEMKRVADGLMDHSNAHGIALNAGFSNQRKTLSIEVVALSVDNRGTSASESKVAQTIRLAQIITHLKQHGVIT